MTKSISCNFTGKDCSWSAESTRNDDEELMSRVKEHVLAEHKEIELNPWRLEAIKQPLPDCIPFVQDKQADWSDEKYHQVINSIKTNGGDINNYIIL